MKDLSPPSLFQDLCASLPNHLARSKQIEQAFHLACSAHENQFRESREDSIQIPYIVHPVGVAKLAVRLWIDDEVNDTLETIVCVALLHDTLEDTSLTYREISRLTNERCAALVLSLTRPDLPENVDRAVRNRRFLEQIKSGGPSAVYLKICDCIHNLSRPLSTPHDLLGKTLVKAKGPYRDLLKESLFEERLTRVLDTCITEADHIWNEHQDDPGNPRYDNLYVFLKHVSAHTRGKILEYHDIEAAIGAIPGVVSCKLGDLSGSVTEICRVHAPDFDLSQIPALTRSLQDRSGLASVPAPGEKGRELHLELMTSRLKWASHVCLVIMVNREMAPEWLDTTTLQIVFHLLSEKLEKRHIEDVFMLAENGWKDLGMDSRTAFGMGVTQHDILNLRQAVALSEQLMNCFESALTSFTTHWGISSQVQSITGRVKKIGSVLKKTRTRNIQAHELDDLVGLRVVLLTTSARDAYAQNLLWTLNNTDNPFFALVPIQAGSAHVEHIESNLGYSAKHIKLLLKPCDDSFAAIGCEIQLRTVYEHAWAQVSEALVYKTRALSKKSSRSLLNLLSELRTKADSEIDKIAGV